MYRALQRETLLFFLTSLFFFKRTFFFDFLKTFDSCYPQFIIFMLMYSIVLMFFSALFWL